MKASALAIAGAARVYAAALACLPRHLQARYGVSRAWLGRHIKNPVFPQPIKFGSTSDGRTARRIVYTNFPRPTRSSAGRTAPRVWRRALIAMNAELARINGKAS